MSTIDRAKECPFLLRIFTKVDGHHLTNEYTTDKVPEDGETFVYTWRNATLKELALLIQESSKDAQRNDTRIVFRLIYWDNQRSRYSHRNLGRVMTAKPADKSETKTLEECKFVIGDFLDVAIYNGPPPPRPERSFGSASRFHDVRMARQNKFGGRDNHFGGGRDGRPRYRGDRF